MRQNAMLAAGLLAAAAMMTGCAADAMPSANSTPEAVQQQTAAPEETEASPDGGMEDEETQQSFAFLVDGKEAEEKAVREGGRLYLPIEETGRLLGWKADSRKTEQETKTDCEITLERENSRITVTYEVSDNTIRKLSWQKDGLLIPVDAEIETINGIVYVPAAFFEEAAGVRVSEGESRVEVSSPEPMDTPQINQ